MTAAQPMPPLARTDAAAAPSRELLLEYAELDELFVDTKITPEQLRRLEEVCVQIAGAGSRGENVGAVLARRLAVTQDMLDNEIKQIAEQTAKLFAPRSERLEKDPALAILPSGRKVSVRDVLDFERWADSATARYHDGQIVCLSNASDIAALDAALGNVGVAVNAPTIAGEDRDGDGRTGE